MKLMPAWRKFENYSSSSRVDSDSFLHIKYIKHSDVKAVKGGYLFGFLYENVMIFSQLFNKSSEYFHGS